MAQAAKTPGFLVSSPPGERRPSRGRRAALFGGLALLGGLLLPVRASRAGAPPSLYVFLSTNVKSSALEKALRAKLPGLVVTVFNRFRDFQDAMAAHRPDALLTLPPVLAAQKLTPALRGQSKGDELEKYVLVSADTPLAGALDSRTIGAVDFLGRAEMQKFVAGLLKTPAVRIKLVTKREELLSLLQFSAADAVLVPAGAVASFSESSKMSLQVRDLGDSMVGRAAVAVLTPETSKAVIAELQGLDAATKEMLGLDSWSAR